MEQIDILNNQDLKINNKEEISNYELLNFLSQRVLSFFNHKTKVNNYTITGGWGTGKTQLLKKLENFINEQNDVKFIWLNLWEYELFNEQEIFMKIVSQVLIEIYKFVNIKKATKWKWKVRNFKRKISKTMNVSKSISIINFFGIEVNKNSMLDLVKEFTELLNDLDSQVVVVFDDLDRCQESKILNILTAIKNFFFQVESNNLFYFTALNENYINEILSSKPEHEKYTTKVFSQENKLQIENLIDYDSTISTIGQYLESNSVLKEVYDVAYKEFKRSSHEINFRKINSELEFICSANFQKKVEKLKTKFEIMDLIFLEFLKRKYFLKWDEFQIELTNSSYKFIEKIIQEKLIDLKRFGLTEKNINFPEKQQIVNSFWEQHSAGMNLYDGSYDVKQMSLPLKNLFFVEYLDRFHFYFTDFSLFLKKSVNMDELFKRFRKEGDKNFSFFIIPFNSLKEMLEDYFLIYFNSLIEMGFLDNLKNNIVELQFFKKIFINDNFNNKSDE